MVILGSSPYKSGMTSYYDHELIEVAAGDSKQHGLKNPMVLRSILETSSCLKWHLEIEFMIMGNGLGKRGDFSRGAF